MGQQLAQVLCCRSRSDAASKDTFYIGRQSWVKISKGEAGKGLHRATRYSCAGLQSGVWARVVLGKAEVCTMRWLRMGQLDERSPNEACEEGGHLR